MVGGYKNMQKKVRVSGVPGALEPATRKKSPENSHFLTLGAILGGFACWVRGVSYPVGTASSLATRIWQKTAWHAGFLRRYGPNSERRVSKMVIFWRFWAISRPFLARFGPNLGWTWGIRCSRGTVKYFCWPPQKSTVFGPKTRFFPLRGVGGV